MVKSGCIVDECDVKDKNANRSIPLISLNPQEMKMDFIKIRFEDDRGMVDTGLQGMIGGALRLFDPALTLYTRVWHPLVDIYETAAEIVITAELAGVNRDDIYLEISRQTVKISGKRAERVHGERSRYHLAEIPYGYFERTLSLGATIDTEGVTARHADGLLEIRIPKLPLEKRIRKIPIQNRQEFP